MEIRQDPALRRFAMRVLNVVFRVVLFFVYEVHLRSFDNALMLDQIYGAILNKRSGIVVHMKGTRFLCKFALLNTSRIGLDCSHKLDLLPNPTQQSPAMKICHDLSGPLTSPKHEIAHPGYFPRNV
uniref:Uncharacterized protein n=1 Tax=Glossina austeni TaxID=7395 RepID=A0A1A9UWN8_GLOAU